MFKRLAVRARYGKRRSITANSGHESKFKSFKDVAMHVINNNRAAEKLGDCINKAVPRPTDKWPQRGASVAAPQPFPPPQVLSRCPYRDGNL